MQMDAGMDTGGMFAKGATQIGEDETAAELTVRLSQLGAELLSETLPLIERGEIHAEPQNDSEATYAPMLKREDGLIDWQKEATEIANRVRAFQPWPASYTIHRGGRLIIWHAKATAVTEGSTGEPAQIVSVDRTSITVACAKQTYLQIMEVQPEGKRRMPARDFLNGAHLQIGDRLTDVTD
jgi:methionyl-tRNA formyltransferase